MDLRMPQVNGFEAARAIHGVPGLQAVPIVAASASSADLERAESDRQTFAVCLRKPFEAADLLDTMEQLLGLSWQYENEDFLGPLDSAAIGANPVLPGTAILEELLELARLGKLVRVEQRARQLEQDNPACAGFAQHVYALARRFEEEKLIALLQRCLGRQHDAVSQ
jgi:CheY-like chemotaxis protein